VSCVFRSARPIPHRRVHGVLWSAALHQPRLSLARFYPQTDLFLWRSGELWRILFRQSEKVEGFDPYYIGGGVLIFGGLGVLYYAWRELNEAQASGVPAVDPMPGYDTHSTLPLSLSCLGLSSQDPRSDPKQAGDQVVLCFLSLTAFKQGLDHLSRLVPVRVFKWEIDHANIS
jgi:hypothetical protein